MKKCDNEKLIGQDKDGIDIIDVGFVNKNVRGDQLDCSKSGKYWFVCPDCRRTCWREVNGLTYYHAISCKSSNGIDYENKGVASKYSLQA